MQVVQANESSKTYIGPWEWHNGSVVESPYMLLEDAVGQGYTAAPPAPPTVPVSVPKWAFLLVLRRAGKEAALKAAIAAYSGPNADRVRAKWEADPDVERNGATINALGASVGYTPEQVDQVFRDAEKEANQ